MRGTEYNVRFCWVSLDGSLDGVGGVACYAICPRLPVLFCFCPSKTHANDWCQEALGRGILSDDAQAYNVYFRCHNIDVDSLLRSAAS